MRARAGRASVERRDRDRGRHEDSGEAAACAAEPTLLAPWLGESRADVDARQRAHRYRAHRPGPTTRARTTTPTSVSIARTGVSAPDAAGEYGTAASAIPSVHPDERRKEDAFLAGWDWEEVAELASKAPGALELAVRETVVG